MSIYQIGIDDIQLIEHLKTIPERMAFIDESGNFGFDFSKEGTSSHFIICAVIVETNKLIDLENQINEIKKEFGFNNTELKSSKIANNHKRRAKLLTEIVNLDFRAIVLVVNKQQLLENSPLRKFQKSFLKNMHKRLFDILYQAYPKLQIVADEHGNSQFQTSFKTYVENNRPIPNLLNEHSFGFCNSKSELLVQLADIIAGSIGKYYSNESSFNYLDLLKGKILTVEQFPSMEEPYWGNTNPEDHQFSSDIFVLALRRARSFISKYEKEKSKEKVLQVAFLRYLLYRVLNVNPTKYIFSQEIVNILRRIDSEGVNRNYVYRQIVAPLRNEGVLIASCSNGYKIPISVQDITTYLNTQHSIVQPMLNRVGICRNLILNATEGKMDILDDPAFIKYKKYFD